MAWPTLGSALGRESRSSTVSGTPSADGVGGDEPRTTSAPEDPSNHVADRGADERDPEGETVRPDATGSASRWTSAGDLRPTRGELQISARLPLHIAGLPRYAPGESPSEALTQAGMARALGTSQGAVSNAVRRLVYGGVLRVDRVHVRGRLRRVKVYGLTPDGESLVREIRARPRD